jgi:hypothetical protein
MPRPQVNRPIVDAAAELTDAVLAALAETGVQGDSVEMELDSWQALAAELEREAGRARRYPLGDPPPLDGIVQQVVHRAALYVAGLHAPEWDPALLESRLRPRIARLRVTAGQCERLARLLGPTERDWVRPLGRSGVMRILTVVAMN